MWIGLKRIGLLLLLVFSLLPLSAQESRSDSRLEELNGLLTKLENELLISKRLLSEQTLQLESLNQNLNASRETITNLRSTITSLKSNISVLEATISSLRQEIQSLQNQTKQVSNSLDDAEKSFEAYKKTNRTLWVIFGVVGGALVAGLTAGLIL